jgi:hypothetical protein
MVNATMQVLKYSFGLDPSLNGTPLDFHKFVHMSSTSYPLASNTEIRQTLASFPLDANSDEYRDETNTAPSFRLVLLRRV